jgi:hypothetical protein
MPQLAEIREAIDGSQQMCAQHVLLEIECVRELVLPAALLTHHRCAPRRCDGLGDKRGRCQFFNRTQRLLSMAFGERPGLLDPVGQPGGDGDEFALLSANLKTEFSVQIGQRPGAHTSHNREIRPPQGGRLRGTASP